MDEKDKAPVTPSCRVRRIGTDEWSQADVQHVTNGLPASSQDISGGAASTLTRGVRYQEGALIDGRYEVRKILGGPGKSGMGVVYVAYDRWHQRMQAIKSYQDREVWDPVFAKRFRHEAELWIGLGLHPHVVSALTLRNPDGRLYLVLEYIEPDHHGRNTLTHYLTGDPLDLETTLKWAIQFCWGIEHAATRGVTCHRDIKPDNLMIDCRGRLKVTDFGLARLLDGHRPSDHAAAPVPASGSFSVIATHDGSICGTPPWMAPEQFSEVTNDPRVDIYAFGVVLFQMATGGSLPFRAGSVREYEQLHREASVPPLDSPLFPIVQRCLEKSPEDRYCGFPVLRSALEAFGLERGISVPQFEALTATPELLKDWAASLCFLGRHREGLSFADQAVALDPGYVHAWVNRSLCHLGLNEPGPARDDAQHAVDLEPTNPLPWNNLACALRRLGMLEDAERAVRRAVSMDPTFRDAWNTLGGLYHVCGRFVQAAECFRKTVLIDPYFRDGYVNLAGSLCGLEDAGGALECYDRVAEIDPADCESIQRRDALRTALHA